MPPKDGIVTTSTNCRYLVAAPFSDFSVPQFASIRQSLKRRPNIRHDILSVLPAGELNMFNRVTQVPNILGRRATLRGLRISVAHVVNLVANGMMPAQIVAEHPDLEVDDVRQALGYAAAITEDQVYPIPASK